MNDIRTRAGLERRGAGIGLENNEIRALGACDVRKRLETDFGGMAIMILTDRDGNVTPRIKRDRRVTNRNVTISRSFAPAWERARITAT